MSSHAPAGSAPRYCVIIGSESLPKDLLELAQFVLWRWETVGNRKTKVPYSATERLRKASVTDNRTWCSFDQAFHVWQKFNTRFAGLGWVFTRDGGMVGIDLDHCLDPAGNVLSWAHGVIQRFSDTYMEVSPSGAGVKIWAYGQLAANLPGVAVQGGGSVEAYSRDRFFTITGRVFRGAPLQIENHADDITYMYQRLTAHSSAGKSWPLQPLEGGRIPHGQQHSTLVSIAGTLRARRVCDEAILACLLEVNARQCERPGPPENIARIVSSSRRWNQKGCANGNR